MRHSFAGCGEPMSSPRRLIESGALTGIERRALLAGRTAKPSSSVSEAVWERLQLALSPEEVQPATPRSTVTLRRNRATRHTYLPSSRSFIAVLTGAAAGIALGSFAVGAVIVAHRQSAPRPIDAPGAAVRERATTAAARVESATESRLQRGDDIDRRRLEPDPVPLFNNPGKEAPVEPPATYSRPLESQITPSEMRPAPVASTPRPPFSRPHFEEQDHQVTIMPAAEAPAPSSSAAIIDRLPTVELTLVGQARDMIRGGRAANALMLLEQARREFPNGIVAEERDALIVEALVATGQRVLAMQTAQLFLTSYPFSPHTYRVRALIAASR